MATGRIFFVSNDLGSGRIAPDNGVNVINFTDDVCVGFELTADYETQRRRVHYNLGSSQEAILVKERYRKGIIHSIKVDGTVYASGEIDPGDEHWPTENDTGWIFCDFPAGTDYPLEEWYAFDSDDLEAGVTFDADLFCAAVSFSHETGSVSNLKIWTSKEEP